MDKSSARLRHSDGMGLTILWALLLTLMLLLIAPSSGNAQVTDITSSGLGTEVPDPNQPPPSDGIYNITVGTRPGGGLNLFHSFGNFSIGEGHIANFLNDSGLTTSNIIGRVTGVNPSNIYGIIRTTDFDLNGVPTNLFLVNPNGIVFGPNGSVNVGGSVSFSTAQYLRLFDEVTGNSANFYADSANDSLFNSVFAMAPLVEFGFLSPAGYGFLDVPDPSATITVQSRDLSVLPGQSISLVGREVVIQGGAQLSAPTGRMHLATAATPGEFAALPGESLANATSLQSIQNNPDDPALATSFTSYGLMSLAPGSSIDVSGANTVFVKDGQLVLSVNNATVSTSGSPVQTESVALSLGSTIVTSNSGAVPGADVQITVGNLQMDGASITSVTTGNGKGGNISITDAQTVNLTNGAQIVSRTDGPGLGGDITVSATDTISNSGFDTTGTLSGVTTPFFFDPNSGLPAVTSGVFSTASSSGNGGKISITAPTVTLENMATLATITSGGDTFANGQGGDLTLNVGSLSLGSGVFGNGALILTSSGVDLSTSLPTGTGQGGTVTVQGYLPDSAANNVTLTNGAIILSLAFGPGLGADVQIAAGTIGLDGPGTAINTWTFGEGNGGNITLDTGDAGTLSVTNNATITTKTFGPGSGGAVGITADILEMEDSGNISTITSGDFGDGVGGNLSLNVGTLTLKASSTIQSLNSNPGSGQGGNVTVQGLPGAVKNAAELVSLTGGSSLASETSPGTAGDGGQISITAMSVWMDEGGISSRTSGTGGGGDILVAVQHMDLLNSATITGSTSSDDVNLAPAGNITVQGLDGPKSLANSITLSGGGAIQMIAPGFGQLGNIEVNAKTLNLTDAAVISAGTSIDTGTAGDLTITAGSVGISSGSRISSQTFASNAGPVTITADQLTMDKGSSIVTSTSSLSGGRGGDVVIDVVGNVSLTNDSSITSETSGTGPGGDIRMSVGTLSLTNSRISSASIRTDGTTNFDGTTEPPGQAWNIIITATGSFTSDASSIATSAEANRGGDISITAQSVQLSNGTKIDASSNAPLEVTKLVLDENGQLVPEVVGNGNAGNVSITSDSNVVIQNSSVTTEASAASGGSIEINASDTGMVQLINSKVSTSVGGVAGSDGGNISIDPQFVVLQNSQIIAQAFAGAGGAINIIATSAFIADPASIVDASSTLGISGNVNIQSPLQNIGGELAALSEEFSSAAALLAQQCAARVADGKFSTFVIAAREGLPAEPGGFLASPSLTTELLGSRLSGRDAQTQLLAVTGLFPKYDAKPIQLAKLGNACHQ